MRGQHNRTSLRTRLCSSSFERQGSSADKVQVQFRTALVFSNRGRHKSSGEKCCSNWIPIRLIGVKMNRSALGALLGSVRETGSLHEKINFDLIPKRGSLRAVTLPATHRDR